MWLLKFIINAAGGDVGQFAGHLPTSAEVTVILCLRWYEWHFPGTCVTVGTVRVRHMVGAQQGPWQQE